ncbi:MAG: RES family NAD+ phosphorylase [Rhodobacter sp.]|nr:RES family NAD+ phosphorylase [Rhodobacter sp.]
MHNVAGDCNVKDVGDIFFVLIPSRFPPVPLYRRIADGYDDDIAAVAELHNPRLREKQRVLGNAGIAVDETSPRFQNWNHAPFTYSNPEGSWFFDRFVRCLEMSQDKQTALAVSVAKRERFLKRTKEAPIGLDMRMLSRKVSGAFLDAQSVPAELPQEERRKLGTELLARAKRDALAGVLFRSIERPSGTRVCVLDGDVLDRAIQGEHFRYVWDGDRVSTLYAFDNSGGDEDNQIDPRDLGGHTDILAA